jgi:hypothetical protein
MAQYLPAFGLGVCQGAQVARLRLLFVIYHTGYLLNGGRFLQALEYPTSIREFREIFQTEEACASFLASVRRPNGPVCPICGFGRSWSADRGKTFQRSACRHKIRLLSGTIFRDTRLPLIDWFIVIWESISQRFGASVLGLQRVLGRDYTSVWNVFHKLGRVMVREGREKPTGTVEVDEALIGGVEEGFPGRGALKKALVVLAVEVINGKAPGRIRMEMIPDAEAITLTPFIIDNVEPGSVVATDGWSGYSGVSSAWFERTVKIMKDDKNALPRVHPVFSLLKRWLLGTCHGAVNSRYLDFCLDEYIFRFDRRMSGNRGKLFMRILEQAVNTPPATRPDLKIPLIGISGLDLEYMQFVSDIMHDSFYNND